MANGNGNGSVPAFFKKWWSLLAVLVGLGVGWGMLKAEVAGKADREDVAEIKREMRYVGEMVRDMSQRQREFFCRDQPAGCR